MNSVTSRLPFIEGAASCKPAIQPSVRLSEAATSLAERVSPIAWLRNSAALDGVKRNSATRSPDN